MNKKIDFNYSCPLPIEQYPNVLLAHGSGGKLMHQLIGKMFINSFDNPMLNQQHDGAVFDVNGTKLAFTTDSYVVQPIFFPGGNIGNLAVNGTVNDLAMCGAKPLYLSAGVILEEGLPMERLWEIVQTMKNSAEETGVQFVTGDTKVVDKGKGDSIFINTAGIGIIEHDVDISPSQIQPGDAVIVSGDIGRHGIAIMAEREGLSFESTIESDCADVSKVVMKMLDKQINVRCLRDLTRGGLASALVEIATSSGCNIAIKEQEIPVNPVVQGACEILGFDPMYVANEGRFVAFVSSDDANKTLETMKSFSVSKNAKVIGKVSEIRDKMVTLQSSIGATRIVEMFSGEQLPRIC
ncbi:MAG: hydrogenase expression/formation protein HypE [Candidatus Marinimicrobia bacterium]|nr:hydrogenase expression/formation protein HypE [Candidatus Neomarinimicrobiota bacterium]MBL7023305.1 hydrogenase expression/formation protein HypE [Candidatus Neomarinimicrobiota bacterium]